MSEPAIERRDTVARGIALFLGASILAGLFALPVAAGSGPTRLRDPVVEPRLATPGALVTFAVTYRNREGSPADWVRVEVGDVVHELVPTEAAKDPSDWKAGVRFEAVVPAPAPGTYAVAFVSFDARRFYDRLEAGSLTVAASPTPTAVVPSPTPAPTPLPTPAPTKPHSGSGTSGSSGTTDGSSGTGGSGSSGGTGSSGGAAPVGPSPSPTSGTGSGSAPLDSGEATPSSSPSSGAAPVPTEPAPSAPAGPGPWPGAGTWDPVADAGSSGSAVGPDGSSQGTNPATAGGGDGLAPDRGSAAEAAGSGPPAGRAAGEVRGSPATIGAAGRALLDGLGVGRRVPDEVWVASVFVTTAGGAAMAMAFLLFGRRRREEDEGPEGQTPAPAAVGMPPSSVLVPDPTVPEHERHLPRWRRPSLLEARKTDPLRTERAPVHLTFGNTALAPAEGRERRRIRYRVVRLLDAPDEVRANEIGILDQGDEVELIERSGVYWLVLCPDGSRGWLHRMVLGEVVEEGSNAGRVPAGATPGAEPSLGSGLLDEILARRPQPGGDRDR